MNSNADGPGSVGINPLEKEQLIAFDSENADVVASGIYGQQQPVVRSQS